jgi:hypothetical protein
VLGGVQAQQAFVQAYAGHLSRAAGLAGEALVQEFRERGPQAWGGSATTEQRLAPKRNALVTAWLPGHRLAERDLAMRLGAPA